MPLHANSEEEGIKSNSLLRGGEKEGGVFSPFFFFWIPPYLDFFTSSKGRQVVGVTLPSRTNGVFSQRSRFLRLLFLERVTQRRLLLLPPPPPPPPHSLQEDAKDAVWCFRCVSSFLPHLVSSLPARSCRVSRPG